ncbi:MAG: monovalent cation/H(+) antiporter subunit G [Rhizobiaceae bacterium]|nr:monovalent cation/H(+) antiporter subunit G [Rhizobiaceae bacterium]
MSNWELASDILGWVFIISGSIFMLIGAYGALRLPDFWTRLHAVSVTDTGGVLLLTAGMVMQSPDWLIAVKLVFIGVFLFITGPTASHAVANAALVSGLMPKGEVMPGTTGKEAKAMGATSEEKSY